MPLEIESIVLENLYASEETFALRIFAPGIAKQAKPGQFVMLYVPGKFLRRPISIASISGGRLTLLIRIAGKGTQELSQVSRNTKLKMLGPLGNPFSIPTGGAVLVGGGIGVAPLIFFSNLLKSLNIEHRLLYGEKCGKYVISQRFLPDGVEIFTEDGSKGTIGTVLSGLPNEVATPVYGCGPGKMIEAMIQQSSKFISTVEVSMEQRMACGYGVCQGCAIETKSGYKLVCKDGPIFPLHEIITK